MRTLTAQAQRATGRRWAELVYLLELTLWRDKYGPTPQSLTLRLSDAARQELGQFWEPLVLDWGRPGDALNHSDPDVMLGNLDVVLANNRPIGGRKRFSDLIRHGLNNDATTWDILYADATLRLLFRGAAVGDDLLLFRLLVEEPVNQTADRLTLRMTGIELAMEDGEDCYRVTTVGFPLCDPDAVNQSVPIPFGKLKNVKPLGLVAGLVDRLAVAMTDTTPPNGGALSLSDADLLARFPTSGTVQIDAEKITYTGKNTSGVTLTGITRGASSTAKVAHDAGAVVFQVLTEYVYVVGENRGAHMIQSVPAVRSDGMLIKPPTYSLELANTTLVPGRSFAVLKFPAKPTISRQIKVQVQDTIAVVDTIGVHDGLTISDNIAFAPQGPIAQNYLTTNALPSGNIPQGPPGQNFAFPALATGGTVQYVRFSLTVQNQTTITLQIFPVTIYGPNNVWSITFTGLGPVPSGGSVTVSWTAPNAAAYGTCRVFSQDQILMRVLDFKADVIRDQVLTKSGAATRSGSVAKSGAASKSGTVALVGNSSADTVLGEITADVNGLQDDASGTLSGTPNALLEVPHDIVKCHLREVWRETDPLNYDDPSWTASRQQQVKEGYKWALASVPTRFSEFRREAGFQGRAELFQEGGRWVYAWRDMTPVRVHFDERNLAGDVVVDWSPRTEIVTELDVAYDGDYVSQQPRQSLQLTSDYADRYGLRRGRKDLGGRTLALPWVRETATATRLGTYWLSQWERERLRPKLRAYWDAIALDKTDCIEIVTPMLSGYGPSRYAVRRKVYDLDDGLLSLECEETDLPPLEVLLVGTYYLLARDGTVSLPAIMQLLFRQAPTVAGQFSIGSRRDWPKFGQYRIGWTGAPAAAGQYRLQLLNQSAALVAAHRFYFPRLQTLTAAFRAGPIRNPTLAALYTMSGAVKNITRSATYRMPSTKVRTAASLYRIGYPNRALAIDAAFSLSAVALNLPRAGRYTLRTLHPPSLSGRYATSYRNQQLVSAAAYLFPPRLVLSGAYQISASWDAPGAIWDGGLRWDPTTAAPLPANRSIPSAYYFQFTYPVSLAAVMRLQPQQTRTTQAIVRLRPTLSRTLTAGYQIQISAMWDQAGKTWDSPIQWDA